ncbi:MAG TPA: hypothetical protein VGG33_28770 [Polyangia bacterium]
MPRHTSAGLQGSRFTSQIPVTSLPPVPSYPSSTTRMAVLPPRRTFEHLAKRRPRWGLRFLLLLIVVGGLTYLSRPFIPWVNDHITQIEGTVQTLGRQYGFIDGTPAPLSAPSGTFADSQPGAVVTPAPAGVALARAPEGSRGMGRPDIQPMGGKPAAPAAAAPAVAPAAKPAAVPAKPVAAVAKPGAPVAKPGKPSIVAARAAARRRAFAQARYRRRLAMARAAAISAPVAAAAAPAAAVAAPAPAPEPAAPAVKPAAKPAAGGGDELDQLMASAVPNVVAPKSSDLDKKLATVQKGAEAPASKAAAAEAAPQLSRSDIQTVMKDVQNEMGDCYAKAGKGGPVDLKLDVAPDGEVRSAVIKGPFAGTPTGACVESKVKATIFPESAGLRFDYRLMVR